MSEQFLNAAASDSFAGNGPSLKYSSDEFSSFLNSRIAVSLSDSPVMLRAISIALNKRKIN
jgi:hypothetical protein